MIMVKRIRKGEMVDCFDEDGKLQHSIFVETSDMPVYMDDKNRIISEQHEIVQEYIINPRKG